MKRIRKTISVLKRQPKYLSVPKIIYIIVGLVSVALFLPVELFGKVGINPILANVGYSLLASDFAGILFDLGNNYSKNKDDKKVYGSVTLGHSMLINDIVIVADYTCKRLKVPEFQNMDFEQQLRSVLYEGINSEFLKTQDYKDATEDVLNWLVLVKNSSKELLDISYIMYENKQFNEKKRTKLRFLISVANEASEQFEKHTLEGNKRVHTLITRINTLLIRLYPEQADILKEN